MWKSSFLSALWNVFILEWKASSGEKSAELGEAFLEDDGKYLIKTNIIFNPG